MSGSPKWRVHTAQLLAEVMTNETCWALKQPVLIFDDLLRQVAARAIQLDDPILNDLMVRLTLYDIADPNSPNHDEDAVERAMTKGAEAWMKLQPVATRAEALAAAGVAEEDASGTGSYMDSGVVYHCVSCHAYHVPETPCKDTRTKGSPQSTTHGIQACKAYWRRLGAQGRIRSAEEANIVQRVATEERT